MIFINNLDNQLRYLADIKGKSQSNKKEELKIEIYDWFLVKYLLDVEYPEC